jgi:hypothetical protein
MEPTSEDNFFGYVFLVVDIQFTLTLLEICNFTSNEPKPELTTIDIK